MHSQNIHYNPALDHLRFFAAILIVVFHCANGSLVHDWHFDIGVPLFFTLSGYLFLGIGYEHKNEKIVYRKFIYNRILRIYPLVTVLFLMTAAVMDTFTVSDFINLLGLNFPGKIRDSWIVGDWGYQYLSFNWWTIGVEFTFYLLFPLIFNMYQKYSILFLIKLLGLIVFFKIFLFYSLLYDYGWKKLAICFNYSFFCNFDIFIVGMIVAYYEKQIFKNLFIQSILKSKLFFIGYVISMWMILINYINDVPIPLLNLVISVLCGVLIVSYQYVIFLNQKSFISVTLSKFGSISFSIYLLHNFVRTGLQGLGVEEWIINTFLIVLIQDQEIIQFVLLLFYIPIILMVSQVTFNIIESPFLNMRVKYFDNK